MPLSKPTSRTLQHHREIHCQGFKREDGLWDIEGHLLDTKPFSFPNIDRDGSIQAGEALHDMWVRLTLDDAFKIHAAEACIDFAPYHHCAAITASFQHLVGLSIAPGWQRNIKQLMGGVKGCTHLRELLSPLATTAFQTLLGSAYQPLAITDEQLPTQKPLLLNSCHSFAAHSPVVQREYPQFYQPIKK